ncbi:MAG: hypothetical protein PHW04_00595 [Candidatus Wallbacteria bacterium]|nr:hypothetical protein [Candidatus Wallbacteria bacterium]
MGKTLTLNEMKIFADFEKLSRKARKEATDFIAYLKAKEEIEATKEIIEDDDFVESIARGEADFNKGAFKKWSEVREDV